MNKLTKIFDIIGGIGMMGAIIVMVTNILLRIVNLSLPGTYELVGYFSLIFASACIPICLIERSHITVDVLTMRLPAIPYRVLEIISGVLDIVSYLVLAYAGYILAFRKITAMEVSDTLKIPVGPLRLFWAICVTIIVVVRIVQLIQTAKSKTMSRAEREEANANHE